MLKQVSFVIFSLAISAAAANAATIVNFTGNSTGAQATGTANITLNGTTSIAGTLTNTAPFDARITAFGFDVGPGNVNGFTGSPNPITSPTGVLFNFTDGDVGNVAQFNGFTLDFAYITGPNFDGGSPNVGLDNGQTLNFMVTGPFAGMTEQTIANSLFVRFQRVGANGEGSDVATVPGTQPVPTPEPASMTLLGSGLLYLARRRMRRSTI